MTTPQRSGKFFTQKIAHYQFITLICSLLLLTSCTVKPKQDYDVNYDFSVLKTFSQLSVKQTDDPLTADRINAEIKQTLLNQGYVFTKDNADFLVSYAFFTEDEEQDSGLSFGLGSGTWGANGGLIVGTSMGIPLGSDTAKIQTIQIDIIDPASKRLIWRGTSQYRYDQGGEYKVKSIQQTIIAILGQFPPKKE
ncbi:DUF4136 domain-containing protein [Shewanella sp. SR43-4]|uniref:DUF4136 domain-containing protein n=1 Tax=Shewanella sp. SR43-4 TaxID=2760942 RepID=UPI0015FC7F5F|nr:DUF4136 domain-containing protein [Shewanella sp. SR43-4]MBB1317916.1 DUF4136 domain-containing protein [Shewanella sp. SR43-4]